jgi:hypothetical protein
MSNTTNNGTCTWVLTSGVWTLQSADCKPGCSCTGPLPISVTPVTNEINDQALFEKQAFRTWVKTKFNIQIGLLQHKVEVPCIVSTSPEVVPHTPLIDGFSND